MPINHLNKKIFFCFIFFCSFFLPINIANGHQTHNSSETTAGRITADNFSLRAIRGIDAIGGIDDWFLTNGTLCATISDKKHETYLSVTGGFLIDLGFCEKNNDQWPAMHFLTNLSKSDILPADSISIKNQHHTSSIIVSGLRDGVRNTTEYKVDNQNPNKLFITNTLTRTTAGKKIRLFGSMVLHPQRALTPFGIDTKNPENSKGFTFPKADTDDILSLAKAISAQDKQILLGSSNIKPGINYSVTFNNSWLIEKNGEKKPLSFFSLNNEDVSLMAIFTRPLPFTKRGRPSILDTLSIAFMDIKKGESVTFTQEVTLLNKDYFSEASIDKSNTKETLSGTLLLPKNTTMRLTIKGANNTPDPIFNKDDYHFTVGNVAWESHSQTQHIFLASSPSDTHAINLPVGTYTVYASRGIEYSVTESAITIQKNKATSLLIETPQQEVQTPNLISADLHVHSAASFDSALPVGAQIKRLVSEGIDIALFSEHHRIVNYQPTLNNLKTNDDLQLITGAEFTSIARSKKNPRTIGHENIFPLTEKPQQFSGGMIGNPNDSLADLVEKTHQQSNRVIQLNHARDSLNRKRDGYFFEHLSIGKSYNPKKPLTSYPNNLLIKKNKQGVNALAIDAMELLNGLNLEPYEKLKLDWFSFLDAGYIITATGNSDSHTTQHPLGIPRNYFPHKKNENKQDSIVKGIQQINNFISTGPIIHATVNKKAIGALISSQQATIDFNVQTAKWINVQQLNIYKNGKLIIAKAIKKDTPYSFPLTFTEDGYIVLEVIGKPTERYRIIYGDDATPIAISNPFFIDANNDGLWRDKKITDR